MTKEQQDRLRKVLYNAKFTTDAYDENPFVGIYFNDLLDIIHDFGQQHPHWIPVEERLPPRAENSFTFSDYVLVCDNIGYMDTACYNFEKNRWDWLNNVTHWMPLPGAPRKEEEEK